MSIWMMAKKNKKYEPMEISVGTIVTIVLLVTLLILGVVLIKNLFFSEPKIIIEDEDCWNESRTILTATIDLSPLEEAPKPSYIEIINFSISSYDKVSELTYEEMLKQIELSDNFEEFKRNLENLNDYNSSLVILDENGTFINNNLRYWVYVYVSYIDLSTPENKEVCDTKEVEEIEYMQTLEEVANDYYNNLNDYRYYGYINAVDNCITNYLLSSSDVTTYEDCVKNADRYKIKNITKQFIKENISWIEERCSCVEYEECPNGFQKNEQQENFCYKYELNRQIGQELSCIKYSCNFNDKKYNVRFEK